jgi:Dolichyl-phosphate-mannose-protein mannosyltransferase
MRDRLEGLRQFLLSTAGLEWLACGAFILLGWVLRTRGVLWDGTFGFWNDEASWAMRLLERPLSEHLIRPPLFMGLTRLSVAVLGKTEFAYRLLPWLAGMATPVVGMYLARRALVRPGARVLLVGILALSEGSIDFSKEFKPYAIGILLHLLLPFLVLRWCRTGARKDLIWACAALPAGVLFCQDVIFLYPGLFLVMAVETLRARAFKQLYLVAGFGVLTAAFVAGMYFGFWRRIEKDRAEDYWGSRYGVFFIPKRASDSYVRWVEGKYTDVMAMPNQRRAHWEPVRLTGRPFHELDAAYGTAWLLLHLLGIANVLSQRRWKEALCFWSPLLVCVLFNFLGFWPFGAFRTNQFLIAETSVLAALGVDWRADNSRVRLFLPAVVLLVLPLVFFEKVWASRKLQSPSTRVLEVIGKLDQWQREVPGPEKKWLFMDHHSCQPFSFYTKYHPQGKRLWRELSQHVSYACNRDVRKSFRAIRKLPQGERVWVMAAQRQTRKQWPRDFRMLRTFRRGPHELIEIRAP